jgi:hypothetical protein
MRELRLIAALVVSAGAFGWMAASADAGIVQFEAESGTLGDAWTITADAGALGGNVIKNTIAGTVTTANYSVGFTEAGTYDLYVRFVVSPNGSTDSFFLAPDFGVAATVQENNLGFAGATPNSILNAVQLVSGDPAGSTWADVSVGDVIWVNFTTNFEENDGGSGNNFEIGTFNVAAPGTLAYQIARREVGMAIDALAFVLSSEASLVRVGADGNLAVVPEPATFLLVGLAGLLPLGWRRRTS